MNIRIPVSDTCRNEICVSAVDIVNMF